MYYGNKSKHIGSNNDASHLHSSTTTCKKKKKRVSTIPLSCWTRHIDHENIGCLPASPLPPSLTPVASICQCLQLNYCAVGSDAMDESR